MYMKMYNRINLNPNIGKNLEFGKAGEGKAFFMTGVFLSLYGEVFNENGEIKSCGRDKCKELIRVAKEFAASGRYGDDFTDFGNEDTGFLNVKTMKAFKEKVSATDVCPKLTAVRKSLEDE